MADSDADVADFDATANAVIISGVIDTINITNAGVGYTTPPTVTITDSTGTGAAATAVIGTSLVSGLTIANGGAN